MHILGIRAYHGDCSAYIRKEGKLRVLQRGKVSKGLNTGLGFLWY